MKLSQFVEEMRAAGRKIRKINCPTQVSELMAGLPIRDVRETHRGIILKGNTFVELGSPDTGSCTFVLWTNDLSLISDGRINLIGPDIQESAGASLPFGQVAILGGRELDEKDHQALERTQYMSDRIEGYVSRSLARQAWGRVSKDAAAMGFCFETLGKAMMAIFKSEIPPVEAVELIFVTSSRKDLQPLDRIATQVQMIAGNISKKTWKAKGYDIECLSGWDCSVCRDRPVCDEVKEVIAFRKKEKLQHHEGCRSM
jgi:CO dehydrogenase/acetyl-CoA synthase beta subunit